MFPPDFHSDCEADSVSCYETVNMAMRNASRVEAEADVEEEEHFGPQPISRLEVRLKLQIYTQSLYKWLFMMLML